MSIIAVVQSQLLQTLFKGLDLSTLQDGQELVARVLNTTSDGKATLDLGGNSVTADFQHISAYGSGLVPGMRLTLKYDNSGSEPKLVLINPENRQTDGSITDPPQSVLEDKEQFNHFTQALGTRIAEHETVPIQLIKFVEPAVAARAESLLSAAMPRIVLLQNLISAVSNQGSLGSVLADIEALFSVPSPESALELAQTGSVPLQTRPLPAPLYNAINAIMAQQLDGEAPVLANDIRQALKQSGLYFESKMANGEVPLPHTDMKAALLALKDITKLMQDMNFFQDSPSGIKKPHHLGSLSMNEGPLPPRRDSMPESQRMHRSELQSHFSTMDAAKILEKHADQALERIKLMQFASMPPSPVNPSSIDVSRLKNQVWTFELPVSLPTETTVAGFKIEQEHHGSNGHVSKIWRVNFAIDTQELGPVHGRIGIQGHNLAITLFAERATTSDVFREGLGDLREALTDSQFELTSLSVFTGKPSQPSAKPGYFVDSAA